MFCRIRVSFEYSKVSVLEKRSHLIDEKVSEKGSLLILENDHTSYLLHLSGGTGVKKSVERGIFMFWNTIIRPPFTFEWRDRAYICESIILLLPYKQEKRLSTNVKVHDVSPDAGPVLYTAYAPLAPLIEIGFTIMDNGSGSHNTPQTHPNGEKNNHAIINSFNYHINVVNREEICLNLT